MSEQLNAIAEHENGVDIMSSRHIWTLAKAVSHLMAGMHQDMYVVRPERKSDPLRQWQLPDKAFFASGACQVLAYAFLRRPEHGQFKAVWIKPTPGHAGNHIVSVLGNVAFDYHGLVQWDRLLDHMNRKASRWWPGWGFTLVPLPTDVLISEKKSKSYEGLWLRQPDQFYRDPLPRADKLIDRLLS